MATLADLARERTDLVDASLDVLNELIFSYSSGRLLLPSLAPTPALSLFRRPQRRPIRRPFPAPSSTR
jgi:hypothetical protein